ncbi:PaaI family thioesterase [Kineobactrum sediminis]|uniref:PaaI family thioesterase n=1 Tax=Kineobactrum sediminis TaxID=1905677 RepID=A0A2N5Y1U4_9GAMM|nr:PaaI family thioesterase [Kineobactrum sediminis]PLW82358.1 PaaI family thioesterase [Kineobactrum sediminis]
MNKQQQIANANTHLPPCLQILNARLVDFDSDAGNAELQFEVSEQFCHSVNVVQGGNVTAMLDAAMSHAAFMQNPEVIALPTLELKVSFLEPTLAGPATARGRVVKAGNSIVFLEGTLINSDGKISATSTSTAKLVKRKQQ